MAKTMKRVISLLLAAVLIVGTFAGCGKSGKNEPAITASAVKFSKSGKYTTVVSSKKVDLSGINAKNVEVRYLDPTADPEAAKAESTEAATEEATTEATTEPTEEIKLEDVNTLPAKVESVKAADKKSYEITFTNDKAAELITGSYIILFKSVEGDDNTASVEVEFPEITLTPDVENVVSDATQAKITLAIDGSTFEDGISEKDIYLDNAFSDMKIESVSASDKNLTVQLKGSPVRNEAGAYQWGAIKVKPSGIKDGYADVTSKVDIQLASAYIDAASLKFENGKINADLKIHGVVDINSLTKDNIKIDGAAVEAAKKADDNTVKLTLSADGVKSVNDFADTVGGKKMTLGDYETTVSVSQASFYPVFDYIEKADDKFDVTLKLYIYGGTVDKAINAKMIGLSEDFSEATVKSVSVDSENLVTLIVTVPSSGFTEENYQFDGAVTLKAGAVTNAWGEMTTADYTYSRNYSADTLGRAGTLNTDTLLDIQKYTRGLNTPFGKIFYYGRFVSQVYSIGKSILEATGVVKSEHVQEMEKLAAMDQKLDSIQSGITDVKKSISDLVSITELLAKDEEKREIKNKIDDFEALLIGFNHAIDTTRAIQKRAALDMALEEAGVMPDYTGMTSDQIAAEKEKLRKQYLPDIDAMTDKEAAQYNVKVMNYLNAKISDPNSASEYGSYNEYIKDLESTFKSICSLLNKPVTSNPVGFYDELCSYTYNFDSQTYDFRLANRVAMQYNLVDAITVLAFHFQVAAKPDSDRYALIGTAFDKAMESSIWEVSGHPKKEIKANTWTYKKTGETHDSDVEFFPYCYTLGSKISLFIAADCENNDSGMAASRKWSLTETKDFLSRMHYKTFQEELKSAGISIERTSDGGYNRYYGQIAFNYKYVWNGHSYNLRIYFMRDDKTIDGYNNSNKDGTQVAAYGGFNIFFMCHDN